MQGPGVKVLSSSGQRPEKLHRIAPHKKKKKSLIQNFIIVRTDMEKLPSDCYLNILVKIVW